jgi:F-box/leucine-rich repeat protein 14
MLQSAFPPTTTTSHLQSINLSNCKRLTNEGLAAVAAACPQLESLDLGGCSRLTNEGLRALAALPCARGNLHRLSLRSCYQITDTGVGHLVGLTTKTTINSDESEAEKSAKIGGLLALEDLSLQDCQKLTDAALCLLQEEGSSCRRTLRRLNLSFCAGITDGGLRSLGRLGALEALCLRACDNIGDRGLAHLAEASVRLNSLDVSFCAVSDTGLAHIAGGLFSLRQLAVVGCCRITDEGLCRVAKTLLDLDTLSVGQCVRLSDRSLEAMAAHLRHLRRLDLYGCPRISAAGVAGLRAAGLPRLTSLNLSLLND